MFENIIQHYKDIEKSGLVDPLFETLRLYDLLTGGALRKTQFSSMDNDATELQGMILQRKQGKPWEYILGKAHFMGRMFYCTPDTLIPTDETKLLVESTLEAIKRKQVADKDLMLIEVGTGCGNIAVSLALHSNHIRILASDISAAAVEVAKKNVSQLNLQDRVSLSVGDLFSPFQEMGYAGQIDFVVCNPPYIPTGSLAKLAPEIIDHEPRVALDGGTYGIDIFRRLIAESLVMLKPKGDLFFEIGERQEKLVARLIEKIGGYEDVELLTHDAKIRAIHAVKKGI